MSYKHHGTGTPVYSIWKAMRQRCLNKNDKRYKDYGGRGITVCDRWSKFENFLADIGERPKGFSLERIDNSKGYFPENCKWASLIEQGKNKRNNVFLSLDGETHTKAEWCRILNIPAGTLWSRVKNGWSDTKALTYRRIPGKL